jgi:large subunit ribosomal protein L15
VAQKDRTIRRRHRGTRNCGRGKKGSRKRGGGRGLAGSHKHKYTWIVKNMPEHFGKHGFGRGGLKKNIKATNVGRLSEYADKRNLKEIDASELGYDKVLGGGKVGVKMTVKADFITKKAKQKIEEAGGKAIERKPEKEAKSEVE